MKKILISLLLVLLTVSGCSSKGPQTSFAELENKEFNTLLDQQIIDSVASDDLSINFLFIKPEDYGVTREPYELGFTTEADYAEGMETYKAMIKDLKGFKDKDLTLTQQADRDALIDAYEKALLMEDFYDYEVGTSVLGFSRAFLGNIPAYLEKYEFHDEEDVVYYLNFLETLQASVQESIDFELKRQTNGTGFSQEELDEIISQAISMAEAIVEPDYYLISHFNDKIKVLNLENETVYTEMNKVLINVNFANAYMAVVDGLSEIDAEPMSGLANRPNGKDYYEKLLQSNTGSSRSIKDIEKILKKHKMQNQIVMSSLLKDEAMLESMFNDYVEGPELHFEDGQGLIDFLNKTYTDYFPETKAFNYELRKVDPSMEEASSPAFYFTPQIDYTDQFKQVIFVKGDYDSKNYHTYGHESTPGHMYQFTYFQDLPNHPIRSLVSNGANAEGWANYSEQYIELMVGVGSDQAQFNKAYNQILQIMHIEMDLGINYYGWSYDEFKDYILNNIGLDSDEELKEIYLNFVHNPATYPTYYLSQLYIEDLKVSYFKAKDDTKLDKEFHEAFLSYGSTSFDVIEKGFKKALQK